MRVFRIIILLIIITFSSFNQEETDLNFEKQVMNEIFMDLVDSIYTDFRLIPPPPLPPPPPDVIITDSLKKENLKKWAKILKEFEKRKEIVEKDTSKTLIIVYDTIYYQSKDNKNSYSRYSKKIEFIKDSTELNTEYIIDLSQFKNNDNYIFKYRTKYPKRSKIWNYIRENPFENYFGGVISFSKIRFDKTRKYGVLTGGISYRKLNGHGVLIFIKKESNKWVIDKIIGTWIS